MPSCCEGEAKRALLRDIELMSLCPPFFLVIFIASCCWGNIVAHFWNVASFCQPKTNLLAVTEPRIHIPVAMDISLGGWVGWGRGEISNSLRRLGLRELHLDEIFSTLPHKW